MPLDGMPSEVYYKRMMEAAVKLNSLHRWRERGEERKRPRDWYNYLEVYELWTEAVRREGKV